MRGLFQEADSGPLVEAFRDVSEAIKPGTEGALEFKEILNDTISVAASLVEAIKSVASAAKWAADAVATMTTDVMLLGKTEAEKTAILGAIAIAKEQEANARASQAEYQQKAEDFDSRFEEHKAQKAQKAAAASGGGGGGHVDKADKFDPELLGRSGGIGGQGAAQWADMLAAMGLAHGATTADGAAARTAATAGAKIGEVHVGGMTVQIHGVANAEEIVSLLPSAIADAFNQAANEMGA